MIARLRSAVTGAQSRYGRPMAVVVRPDVVWSQPGPEVVLEETDWLITALRERARRHGASLEQELSALPAAARAGPIGSALPPIRLATVRGAATSTWSREEIYGDEGR
jgi:hypothetical protein